MVRAYAAKLLGIDISNIRATPPKSAAVSAARRWSIWSRVALALSKKSGRPVKMQMTREEVFRASGPTSGATIEVKIGAKKDGTIVAAQQVLKYQAGAFPGSPIQPGCMCGFAMYDIPNVEVIGYDVVSNRPKVAAYRAPGAPISSFAVESAMDDLARKLNMDPITLREKNGAHNGTKTHYGPTHQNIGFLATLEAAKNIAHWKSPLKPGQGRGIACGFWFNIGGELSAAVHVAEDGTVVAVSGSPDIGGSRASIGMMVAEVLRHPGREGAHDRRRHGFDRLHPRDRRQPGDLRDRHGGDHGGREGGGPAQAARRDDLGHPAGCGGLARRRGVSGRLQRRRVRAAVAGRDRAEGGAHRRADDVRGVGERAGRWARASARISATWRWTRRPARSPSPRYTAVQDVGKAIHPSYVEGQIQGGAVQGIGWALNEEYIYDKNGKMDNPGFLDYRCPVASDLPMIEAILVEVPNPRHPFGARGVGEVPIIPPMAAVANAIRDAIGLRMPSLPMSPPKVRKALDVANGDD